MPKVEIKVLIKPLGLNKILLLLFVASILALTGCSSTRNIPEGSYLVNKNKVIFDKVKDVAERERLRADLSQVVVQKTNRKLLGMPMRLWIYNNATKPRKKINKFRNWLQTKVGEPPVVFDSLQAQRTISLMENYLFNYGYFYGDATFTVATKKKKMTVTYTVKQGPVWRIGNVVFPVGTTVSEKLVKVKEGNTYLKKGLRFDITTVNAERVRIENDLRNSGYYYFNKEYITYDFDTTREKYVVDIKMKLYQPTDTTEHQPYRINDIYVISDYDAGLSEGLSGRDTVRVNEFLFIQQKMKIKRRILMESIFFRKGELFTADAFQRTLRRLNELGTFKFVSLEFNRLNRRDTSLLLNGFVYLTPAKKQTLMGGIDANHNFEGLTGLGGQISYRNRNLSKGADQLQLDFSANIQLNFSKKNLKLKADDIINTVLLTADATYYLNRFALPFKVGVNANTNPKTRINGRYSYEIRHDFPSNIKLYTSNTFTTTYGYEWSSRRYIRHYYNPTFLNFFTINKTDSFNNFLAKRPSLKRSYDQQITWGSNYAFIYSNQKSATDLWYTTLRGGVEIAGNILYAGFRAANSKSSQQDSFLIFKVPFSQYARFEAEWRNYVRITRHSSFAMRSYAGIGIPYGNSKSLPYVKQFFVGGLNSLRGFQIREIGPGGFVDSTVNIDDPKASQGTLFIDQVGDIKMEVNAEIRFDIYKWLKGAAFIDAGNVWLIREDPSRPKGVFEFNRFWREFGISAGAGVRMDFNFFVIRLDYGVPIRDPRIAGDNKWTIRKGQFNLGIGYPF